MENTNRKKTLVISSLFLVVAVGIMLYVFRSRGQTTDTIETTNATITEEKIVTKTYTNEQYGFSIDYPCDARCQTSPREAQKNAHLETEFGFYADNSVYISIGGFTDESVEEWNMSPDVLGGPGYPFHLSLASLREALTQEVDSSCGIIGLSRRYGENHVYDNCRIVMVGGQKAVRLANASYYATYPNRYYFVNNDDNYWIRITEIYPGDSFDFLSDPSKITPELQQQIDAAAAVINTVKFF